MKYLLALLLVLLPAIPLIAQNVPAVNWQRIHEIKSKEIHAYYDASSLEKLDNNFSRGLLLVSYPVPRPMMLSGKKVMVGSVAKLVVADCTNYISSTVQDVYFEVALPAGTDKILHNVVYPTEPLVLESMHKESIAYRILCGIQV